MDGAWFVRDLRLEAIAQGVMDYANEHYEEGWDTLVECFTVPELLHQWQRIPYKPRTLAGAIAHQWKVEKTRNDYAADIVAAGE